MKISPKSNFTRGIISSKKPKIFLFIFFCLFIELKSDRAIIEVRNSIRKIDTFYSLLLRDSISNNDFDQDEILNLSGKICNVNATEFIFAECFRKFENYNYEWIILANDSDYLKAIYKFKEELSHNITYNPWRIVSIIYNNDTISINQSSTDGRTPLFAVTGEMYANLEQYDISNRNDNYMLTLLYSKLDNEGQNQITYLLSILLSCAVIAMTIIWHILAYRIPARDSTGVQKVFTVLLYLRLILSLVMIYFIYLCIKTLTLENFADSLMKIYVETIMVTLNAVLQTLVWFNILIIAFGWQIHRAMFTRNELRNLVVIFISLYMLICFDQIVDMIFDFEVWKFKPSDVKNFFLYSTFAFLTIRYCERSKKILRQRCIYALNFSREYFPALKLKLSMTNCHLIATLTYSLLYIALILISRTVVKDLITNQLKMIITNYVDTSGLIMLVLIYRPQRLPDYFSVFYDEEINFKETKFNIYGIKLSFSSLIARADPQSYYTPISDEKINKNEIKAIIKNKAIPVVIVNPVFEEDRSGEKNLLNLLNHVTIGLRS